MKPIKPCCLALTLFASTLIGQAAYALETTPAAQDKLRIHTSHPKRTQDSLFSYTAEWRIDDGLLYRATGISFLNGAKLDGATSPGIVAKKLVTSMKDAMIQLDPNWRGATITQTADQPELTIANKTGFSLTTVTVRDYSNQALRYDLDGKSFNAEGIQLGLDIVLTADVEYLDGFSSLKGQTASQGEVIISIDNHDPVHIKTDGKTTKQIEEEIAKHLSGSQLSLTPLYEGLVSTDTRNNKPFDNSEVQILNLAAKSISIDITDPTVGILTKFKFKDENHTVKVMEPRFMLGVLAVVSFLAVGFSWYRNKKQA